jgi:hypothetical protein
VKQLLAVRDLSDAIASRVEEGAMHNWQATFLGLKQLPRELTAFEIEAFFTFTLAERQLIEDRRRPGLMLGLALQMGFWRMSGRLLDAVRAETRHRYGYPAFEESQSVGI